MPYVNHDTSYSIVTTADRAALQQRPKGYYPGAQ